MKVYINIVLLLISNSFYGQSILVNFVGNDCTKCQIILSAFLKPANKMPSYFLVFPEVYRPDSADMAEIFPDFKGRIIFSNYYSDLVNPKSSCIAYLNADGKIMFKKPLASLSPGDRKVIDSLYESEATFKTQRPLMIKYVEGWRITENKITGVVLADSGSSFYKFSADSITVAACFRAIDRFQPGFYRLTKEAEKNKEVSAQQLKPVLKGYALNKGIFYYTIAIPYVTPPDERDIALGLKGRLTNSYVMIEVRNDTQKRYFPIVREGPLEGENYVTRYSSFAPLDDSSFIFFQYLAGARQDTVQARYLSVFKIRDGRIVLDRQLDNCFPRIYFSTGVGFKLAPTMATYDYPYYVPPVGTQIADVRNGKDVSYTLPYPIDYARMNARSFIPRLIQGEERLPISNRYLFNKSADSITYLISMLDRVYLLSVFKTTPDFIKLVATVNLSEKIPDIADYAYFDYDKEHDIIRIEDKAGVVRSFPVRLLTGG